MCKKRKNSEWFKNNYLVFVILCIVVWLLLCHFSNKYELISKNIETLKEGKVVTEEYKVLESKHFIFELLSNLSLTLGITLFITMFFSNYFTKKEREDFEKRLEQFQKETAENAFFSLFHQIVDESFFNVIKTDVIQCKKIRKNAKWIYDIVEKEADGNKHLELLRTIKYTVVNLSSEQQNELMSFSAFSNDFHTTEFEMAKTKTSDKKDYEEHKKETFDSKTTDDGVIVFSKEIPIEGNSSVDFVKIVKQTFKSNFIYETQFANCPLAGLEIEVNYPVEYKFELTTGALSELPIKDNSTPGRTTYTFNNAILKGQGIEFYCEKK